MMEKFKKYDVDNDGKISKKELVTWVFSPNGADEKACFTEMVQAEMARWFACLISFLVQPGSGTGGIAKQPESLERVTLPDGLQSLTFSFGFKQGLERVILPGNLQSLSQALQISWQNHST